jgi:hypothetical protein
MFREQFPKNASKYFGRIIQNIRNSINIMIIRIEEIINNFNDEEELLQNMEDQKS